jgi:ABC-type amino acid transport substrate-binding protein
MGSGRLRIFGLVVTLGIVAAACTGGGGDSGGNGGGASGTGVAAIKDRGVLRQCTFMGYKPMSYLDQNGEPAGFDVKLGQAMADSLGVEFKLIDVPFENLIAGVQSGQCDLILSSMTPRAERAESVLFARLYVPFVMALMVRADETRDTIEEWNTPDVTFCVQIGTFSEFVYDKFFPRAKVHKLNTLVDCALEVTTGRADAQPQDDIASNDYANEHPELKVIMSEGGQLGTVSAAPAVALGNEALAEWIDVFIAEYIASGDYETLFKEELGFEPDIDLLLTQR